MSTKYKLNHYVPKWYQKRFLPSGQNFHFYLDLKPDNETNNGHNYTRKNLLKWGPKKCFAQDDLYTTVWGNTKNREIEQYFFNNLDQKGGSAVEHFSNFEFNSKTDDAWNELLIYLSVQKLRTPKGLAWLKNVIHTENTNDTLIEMQKLRNMFCNVWSESIWQIADASQSPTKLIISDHPVVTYNRDCFPASKWCSGFNDPDVRFVASHTYFPLSSEKILIFTNLAWVRNPFQNPIKLRPNPRLFGSTPLFSILDIQQERMLTEEEVLEINYITKKRAFRYIAAAKEEWLFPEHHLTSTNWRKLGDGYLFMPDPRHISGGGETFVKYEGGGSDSWNEYGQKRWEKGYKDENRERREWDAMQKFKAEWSATYGPEYRGITMEFGTDRRSMGEKWYLEECLRDKDYLKQRGERARRRRLKR